MFSDPGLLVSRLLFVGLVVEAFEIFRLRRAYADGGMFSRSMLAILYRRFGVRLPGLEERLPAHPTLGDVDSPEALANYQEQKRAHKARMRAAEG